MSSYTNPIALNAAGQRVGVGEVVDGEQVIYRVNFNRERWLKQRCVNCCCIMSSQPLYCINGLIYALCAGSCRQAEFESLDVFVTGGIQGVSNGAIHAKLKLYGCGCCCQQTVTKTIPLDKVQDVTLVSDCCGDNCGFAASPGRPWKAAVETASSARPGVAELVLEALEDPEGFRAAIMAAKKGMPIPGSGLIPAHVVHAPGGGGGGGGKDGEGVALMATAAPRQMAMFSAGGAFAGAGGGIGPAAGDGAAGSGVSAEVLSALLRIEKSINDGVALMAAAQGIKGGAVAGGVAASAPSLE